MSRSSDDAPNLAPDKRASRGTTVVNEVRRLMMRLATQLNSHSLDLARMVPRANTADSQVDLADSLRSGARETEAAPAVPRMPSACLPQVIQPDLDAGTGPLAPHCIVSADQARLTRSFRVSVFESAMALPAPTLAHPVHASASVTSFGPATRPSGGRVADATLTRLPSSARVVDLTPPAPALPKPVKNAPRSPIHVLSAPVVRPVPERIISELALERRCAQLPALDTVAGRTAHLMTRQLLAAAAGAGVSEQEITIVGIYRRVPISVASKMAFDDQTNALCLTLRPDAARMVQSQGAQLVSLVFGRVQPEGRLVRALVPASNSR